jgi:hypothetical protein
LVDLVCRAAETHKVKKMHQTKREREREREITCVTLECVQSLLQVSEVPKFDGLKKTEAPFR